MKVAKEFRWEMAHRLQHHKGKCSNLHGHSYKMIVEFKGTINNDRINYGLLFNNPDYIQQKAFIHNSTITEFNLISSSIYHSIVRWTLEIFP